MKCPLCQTYLELKDIEEIFETLECNCGRYAAELWDGNVESERVELTVNDFWCRVIFDRAKNETQVYEVCVDVESLDQEDANVYTEHLITVPLLKDIPSIDALATKVRIWLTFS